jgi:hypothetical protein
MAFALPLLLRGLSYAQRIWVGAEGRLAAIAIETDHPIGPLPKPWQALAQGGEELNTFLDNKKEQFEGIKPKLIRIDHIYDALANVSSADNVVSVDWSKLDILIEKIRIAGATPYLSLSYMPSAIAKDPGDITSLPKDWNLWQQLVQKTIDRYSREKAIPNIYYEVWNEPDLFGKWEIGSGKNYLDLYLASVRGANNVFAAQPFFIGGPATTGLYKNWVDDFFKFALENRIRVDFYSWHRYDKQVEKYIEDVDNVQAWIDSHPYFASVKKIISEMGLDSEAGGQNNTNAGAAHLVSVSRELLKKIDYGFSFSVTGKWGIMGKPRQEALNWLSSLGEERLGLTGEGSWVRAIAAQKGSTYQVLVTNYDPDNKHSEVVPVTFINLRDQNFTLKKTIMGAAPIVTQVATTAAILQSEIPMLPNSVAILELTPINTSNQ